jgi:pyrimidine deaminase RibD-like protein
VADQDDKKFMEEAISWADKYDPEDKRIPRVGAIIVDKNRETLGRGRRGTGLQGDDRHAEENALDQVKDKTKLPGATLYTTLEPCTPEVRSNPLTCCTNLILQHHIKRVFIGILDPNQGVSGKGLNELQQHGVEIELFPHDLAKKILTLNADFVRLQKSLGAQILGPKKLDELHTYKTRGVHPVRFRCENAPDDSTYLMVSRYGLWWPQPDGFRNVGFKEYEIDARFGTVGEHTLHIVTANQLGRCLIQYYRKIVDENYQRLARIKARFPGLADGEYRTLIGTLHPGIPMSSLLKGFQAEESVTVKVVPDPTQSAAS